MNMTKQMKSYQEERFCDTRYKVIAFEFIVNIPLCAEQSKL